MHSDGRMGVSWQGRPGQVQMNGMGMRVSRVAAWFAIVGAVGCAATSEDRGGNQFTFYGDVPAPTTSSIDPMTTAPATAGTAATTGATGSAVDSAGSASADPFVPDPMEDGMQGGAGSDGFAGASGSAGTSAGSGDTAGSGGTDAAGTGGSAGSGGTGVGDPLDCPAGFESQRPLVLTGDTVPGNLELGLATAPETPREPCGTSEEQICFNLINAERARIGKAPLIWDGDLADLGRSHAADRSQQIYPGTQHGSSTSTSHLYQDRAEFLGLKNGKFASVVENACKGVAGGERAFNCWMGSPGHYQVMMSEGSWSMLTHGACGGDGTEWNLELGW